MVKFPINKEKVSCSNCILFLKNTIEKGWCNNNKSKHYDEIIKTNQTVYCNDKIT